MTTGISSKHFFGLESISPRRWIGDAEHQEQSCSHRAMYDFKKSLQYVLAAMLGLAFLSPLHKQGYCSRTEISSSWSLTQAAHKASIGTVLQVALHSGPLVPIAGLRHPVKKRQYSET